MYSRIRAARPPPPEGVRRALSTETSGGGADCGRGADRGDLSLRRLMSHHLSQSGGLALALCYTGCPTRPEGHLLHTIDCIVANIALRFTLTSQQWQLSPSGEEASRPEAPHWDQSILRCCRASRSTVAPVPSPLSAQNASRAVSKLHMVEKKKVIRCNF